MDEDLIHPPSILPISWRDDSSAKYFLLSRIFKSLHSRMNIFAKSSFALAFCNIGSFSAFDRLPAKVIASRKSRSAFSHRCPSVYLSFLGKLTK